MEKINRESADSGSARVTVQALGASLVVRAMESMLAADPGFAVVRDGAQVVLLIGDQGMKAVRKHRMRKARKGSDHFVLIADGSPIDFELVRNLPIGIFVDADDSLEILLEALRAAAAGSAYCSPHMVHVLVESTQRAVQWRGFQNNVPTSLAKTTSERPKEQPLQMLDASDDCDIVAPTPDYVCIGQQSTELVNSAGRVAIALGLSEREWEVAALAVSGLMNSEICEKLSISIPTVKFLLYRTYQKLGIKRRAQLASALMIKPTESVVFAMRREHQLSGKATSFDISALAS